MKDGIHVGRLLCAAAVMMLLTGCATPMMTKTSTVSSPPAGKAIVTFVRPTMFGGAIQFGIWDSDKFVGILAARSYVQYAADPGEHLFLARAENWSYVKANLEAGKEYFVVGKVFPGVWKARVALAPVKKDELLRPGETAKVEKWLKDLSPTVPMASLVDRYSAPRVDQVRQSVEKFKKGKAGYGVLEAEDGR